MKTENSKYPKVRVTEQAHAHLAQLIPAIRKARGLNISMTDLVSEAILAIPLPVITQPIVEKKRRARKPAVTSASQMLSAQGA